jgi:hypothetical protein
MIELISVADVDVHIGAAQQGPSPAVLCGFLRGDASKSSRAPSRSKTPRPGERVAESQTTVHSSQFHLDRH